MMKKIKMSEKIWLTPLYRAYSGEMICPNTGKTTAINYKQYQRV
jgi:hypothetical protein